MHNRFTPSVSPLSAKVSRLLPLLPLNLLALLCFGFTASWVQAAAAQTARPAPASPPTSSPTSPSTAPASQPTAPPPAELTTALSQIDAAASTGDLQAVMQFYSRSFTSSDGLTHDTLEQTLSDLWKRYPKLTYSTTLESWEVQADGLSTVTTTTITGSYPDQRRDLKLKAVITARQQFSNNQIVRQEILAERSELSTGQKPPTLTISLPEKVAPGENFDFDAVVAEPLGERILLGAALEEPVNVENYLNPAPIELELLASGGLFKVGQVPKGEGDRWISAVIVRYDGITAVTQRLRVSQ